LYGTVTSASNYRGETAELGLALVRNIAWRQIEISRDRLTTRARNTLGSTLTIFKIPDEVAEELRLLSESPNAVSLSNQDEDEIEIDNPEDNFQVTSLEGVQHLALEKVKDLVVSLDWDEMQELVAGILRAMGYKTQVSPPGPDRGRDIVASPDGFGFEHPRIVVEVKHRSGQVGAQSLRSFIGGRHPDDRGLFVSTGGFTKEAKYEADRSNVPLTLWDIDTLVRTLIENYEQTDSETKRLIPLKKIYIPA
jgi:restriction system protein